jgi:hypothetical protein
MMGQQGKGGLVRVAILLVALALVAGVFLFVRQQKASLNTVEKIEAFVSSGQLVRKSLDDAKAALKHDTPTPKAGEDNVYLFDMRQRDPSLDIIVEIVVRNNVIARNLTYPPPGAAPAPSGG